MEMKNKSRVNNLVAALKERGINISAESFFKNPVDAFINIVTPCSRPENLKAIAESINIPSGNYRWIVVHDADEFPDMETTKQAEQHLYREEGSIAGHAQRNFANRLISDGYVLQLDDDTILHPDFWGSVKNSEEDLVSWAQLTAQGHPRLPAGRFLVGAIDSGSFMVKRSVIGDLQWDASRYDADGYFAQQVVARTTSQRKIERYLSYYNYLRP